METISVVVPVREEFDRLERTLASIAATRTGSAPLEFVLVDDASPRPGLDDIEYERVAPGVPVRTLRLEERVGVGAARNHGAAAATGDLLVMTDAHVEFSTGWDEHVLALGAPDRILAAAIADTNSDFLAYGCVLVVPFMGTYWLRENPGTGAPVQIASAAGTVVPRALFESLGGYDEGMLVYGSAEPEFSVRAWLAGAEVVALPEMVVTHRFKRRTEHKPFLDGLRPLMIHNNLRFGLLYLPDEAALQMVRHFTQEFPDRARRGLELVADSDVWERRDALEATHVRDFEWFVDRFDLTDQVGEPIIGIGDRPRSVAETV